MQLVNEFRCIGTIMITEKQKLEIEEKWNIPVTNVCPNVYYIVSIDQDGDMPNDIELEMLAQYQIAATRSIYREYYADKILAMKLPRDAGHNTSIFHKSEAFGWRFRRQSWYGSYGPSFREDNKLNLMQAMNRDKGYKENGVYSFPKVWAEIKQKRPDIFLEVIDKLHKEKLDGEIFLTNIEPIYIGKIGWNTKRMGKEACVNGIAVTEIDGLRPVFVQRQQLIDAGFDILENPSRTFGPGL